MSGNKKANDFLKECMADALIGLMNSKDFSKITINEIALSTGVNRSTWFRNFEDKSEALSFKLVRLWCRWMEEHGMGTYEGYTVENAGDFFRFCHENRALLDLILKAGLQSAIYEAFYEIVVPRLEADTAARYESRFYSYGLFGLFGEWRKREYQETPEEMVKMFYNMIGYKQSLPVST